MTADHVTENQDGIFMPPSGNYELPDEKREWTGKWIWASESIHGRYQECPFTLFQKREWDFAVFSFKKMWNMDEELLTADLYITSDGFYQVFINGRFVGRGSSQPGGDYANCDPLPFKFYEHYPVKDFVVQGENTILIRSCLGPIVQSEVSCGHGGVIADLVIETQCGTRKVQTDGSWQYMKEEPFLSRGTWDGRKEDHSGVVWHPAEIVKVQERFPELLASQIPNLCYAEKDWRQILDPFHVDGKDRVFCEDHVIRIKAGAPYTFWLDYGKLYAAYPHMAITGAAGVKITLHMQEFPGKIEREGTTETYILRDGDNRIDSLRMHSIQYIQVTVSNLYRDIEIRNAAITASIYPSGMKGDFRSDDPVLREIYLLGCRTNQICRQTYHMDSPIHQEPLGCMGDYMIESLMNYYTFGDQWLTRFDILKISRYLRLKDYIMFHPSYCLLYIQMIYDYVMYSGDVEILETLEETVTGIERRFAGYLGENGLMEHAPNYMFMDWVEEGVYNRHHPPKCMGQGYLTAMYVGALDNVCKLLELNGHKSRTEQYRKKIEQVSEAINRLLWNKEKGLYMDGLFDETAVNSVKWMPADCRETFYSQHMNTLAVLYDIAPKTIQKDLMIRVMEDKKLSQAQPYFMHFVFDALAKTGLFGKYGISQIHRWKQLAEENASGLKEVWHGFDCDYSHAWGGTPTYQLPAKVLGITPAAPGFSKVRFMPCLPEELGWAEGTIPTPKGDIMVAVRRKGNEILKEIKLPEEMELEI